MSGPSATSFAGATVTSLQPVRAGWAARPARSEGQHGRMVDDDVSTLLKLDEKGFHAGGTLQAGSRPLFVASGGFTVNPPDLASAAERLRSLLTGAREAIEEAVRDLPDPAPTIGDAIEAIRTAVADLRADLPDLPDLPDRSDLPGTPDLRGAVPDLRAGAAGLAAAIPKALPSPDPDRIAADARDLAFRARQAVGLAPKPRSLVEQLPRWLPGGLLAIASVTAAGAVIVLWDPVHGARRRARLRRWFDGLRGRGQADTVPDDHPPATAPLAFTAIPVDPGAGTPVVGVQLQD